MKDGLIKKYVNVRRLWGQYQLLIKKQVRERRLWGQYQILRPMDLSIATVPCQMDGLPKVTCLGLPNQNLNLFKV